jgi:hypothetical protein
MIGRQVIRLGGPVVVAGVVWAVVSFGQGREVNVGYLAGVAVLSAATLWLVSDLLPAVPYVSWRVTGTYVPRQPGPDMRLVRMSERLASNVHRDTVAVDVHHILTAVVDERLRTRHGVDRSADPASAASLLGPDLTAYLDADPHGSRFRSNRQLAKLLNRIEEL